MDHSVLRKSALTKGLDEHQVERLESLGVRRQIVAGARLFSIGGEAVEMLLVLSGRVELSFPLQILGAEKLVVLETSTQGDVIAWSAAVPPHRLRLTGICAESGEVLVFRREDLQGLFDREPVTGRWVMSNLAEVAGRRLFQVEQAWTRWIQRSIQEKYR